MKPKLLLLSDLWGAKNGKWIESYTKALTEKYEVTVYDCCELGRVDTLDYTQESLHQQFVNGGIKTAVEELLKKNLELLMF